jgi:coenzyme F420 biosynthesis associated uncharacterized protein
VSAPGWTGSRTVEAPLDALADGPIDWALAERVARAVAGRHPPVPGPHPSDDELAPMAVRAQEMVAAETGLRPPTPAHVRVIDRPTWAAANVASFRVLLEPLAVRWRERMAGRAANATNRSVAAIGRRATAVELGLLLGWMAGRVLGQYDLLPAAGTADGEPAGSRAEDPDAVYLVGPNIAMLEQRFGFPPEEFRLWVTLHELTHRAQFTGVPWMRGHYLGLVHRLLSAADPDPAHLVAALRELARQPGTARTRLREGGLAAVIAPPAQREALEQVAGLMALLEGHGDVTMNRAGSPEIPTADRFARVLAERRRRGTPLTRLVQQLVGIEAKLGQYRAGERFIAEIEAAAGPGAIDRCWRRPDDLPTWDEIREPSRWIERVTPHALEV